MKSIAEFGNSKCVAFVSMDAASLYYSRYLIHRASPILHTFIQFIAIYINSHTKINFYFKVSLLEKEDILWKIYADCTLVDN